MASDNDGNDGGKCIIAEGVGEGVDTNKYLITNHGVIRLGNRKEPLKDEEIGAKEGNETGG
jgi:hypothetical protein